MDERNPTPPHSPLALRANAAMTSSLVVRAQYFVLGRAQASDKRFQRTWPVVAEGALRQDCCENETEAKFLIGSRGPKPA